MNVRRVSALLLLAAVLDFAQRCEVTLTISRPKSSCPVPSSRRPLLELPVSSIINPGLQPFSISAYLEAEGKNARELIGTVTPYPPDQPGRFILRSEQAFLKLPAATRISLEIRLLSRRYRSDPLSVTVGPLRFVNESS